MAKRDDDWFAAMWTTVFVTVPEDPGPMHDCPQCAYSTRDNLALIAHMNGNHGPNQYYPFGEAETIPFTQFRCR